jgi:hypothetical protein
MLRRWQMQQAGSAFDGVSFHCYQGSVSDQASFTSQYPNKVNFGLLVNSSLSESFRKYTSRSVREPLAVTGGAISRYLFAIYLASDEIN